ncbi:Phosphate regulon transcriptional regulatory protein PhoB (SphR) [Desulfosporosinus sp. I2]|uniref:response regulator n=1 Tax=Desulfosporosinus sp. I2 TaxID=1617025 RepID=UPI0005F0157F|nr:response regulator [Desulfosporosinus sp. I2]KJR45361.1 Phosphate regulon transcriptional regulatory protein PhoB (SphR) [Desulfosporosinus sp. I2]
MNYLRVLVADDEEKIRQAIGIYLRKEGFTIGEAVDGEETLRKFCSEPWDIIILDVMMPGIDGPRHHAKSKHCGSGIMENWYLASLAMSSES